MDLLIVFANSLVIWCVLLDDVGVGGRVFTVKQQNQVWPNMFIMNNFISLLML